MKMLCVLEDDSAAYPVNLKWDSRHYHICQSTATLLLTPGQARGLASALAFYLKQEGMGLADPDVNVLSSDTVALLCAAARKWAKWDARSKGPWSGGCNLDEADAHARCVEKVAKWRDRTLSYGHHLLAEPVKDETTTMCYPRLADPHMELARLDTLVQQLRARVANLEKAGG